VIQNNVLAQVEFVNRQYSNYLQQLYGCANQTVRNLGLDQRVVINQYDLTLNDYGRNFGSCINPSFNNTFFQGRDLISWIGRIYSINGNVVTVIDDAGRQIVL